MAGKARNELSRQNIASGKQSQSNPRDRAGADATSVECQSGKASSEHGMTHHGNGGHFLGGAIMKQDDVKS